jgi:hypothetical protein
MQHIKCLNYQTKLQLCTEIMLWKQYANAIYLTTLQEICTLAANFLAATPKSPLKTPH